MMNDRKFLKAIKEYIENSEITFENEWGSLRPLSELIVDDKMPTLYAEVLRRLESIATPGKYR